MVWRRRARRGNNALEFALTLPIFGAFLTGVVDYGWYFNQDMAAAMVVRDAARAASLAPLGVDVASAGEQQGDASMLVAGLEGTTTCVLSGSKTDQEVSCQITAVFEPFLGLVPLPSRLEASVTMRMEEQPL